MYLVTYTILLFYVYGCVLSTVLINGRRRYSINSVWFRIHSKAGLRFSEKVRSIYEPETGYGFGETCPMTSLLFVYLGTLFAAKKPFNLPSKSETGFATNLNPDSIIECPVIP